MGDATPCSNLSAVVRRIPLSGLHARGRFALVDAADYGLVAARSWHVWEREVPGRRTNGPYAMAKIAGRQVYMHKLITGFARTDHENHDGLDNRRVNLRDASSKENASNMRPYLIAASAYKGVSRNGNGWSAKIWVDGVGISLGTYPDEQSAALAYDDAARYYQGSFAYLNFPEDGQPAPSGEVVAPPDEALVLF